MLASLCNLGKLPNLYNALIYVGGKVWGAWGGAEAVAGRGKRLN